MSKRAAENISSSVNSRLATLRISDTDARTASPKTGQKPVQVAI